MFNRLPREEFDTFLNGYKQVIRESAQRMSALEQKLHTMSLEMQQMKDHMISKLNHLDTAVNSLTIKLNDQNNIALKNEMQHHNLKADVDELKEELQVFINKLIGIANKKKTSKKKVSKK